MSNEEQKLERCAKVLFDADPHTALKEVYRKSNMTLQWNNAPSRLKMSYRTKAKRYARELGYNV